MSGQAPVTGGFAEFLEANRGTLNHEVAAVARQSAGFDAAAFAEVLRTSVAPIVDAVEQLGTGFVVVVSETLFRVALDLCAQRRFAGAVRDGWDRLLPAVAPQLTADPRRVVASVTNALDSLERAPGARPGQWIDLVLGVASHAPTVDDLLRGGQVAAWRSGMAAYRDDALGLAAALEPDLAAAALGLAASSPPGSIGEVVARLRADPWFDPSAADADGAAPRPTIEVGAFRGFGGAFLRPPTIVAASDARVLVTDGAATWAVFADAFGSALVRTATGSTPPAGTGPSTGPPPAELTAIAEISSWARAGTGLVATSGLRHAVLFVGSAA